MIELFFSKIDALLEKSDIILSLGKQYTEILFAISKGFVSFFNRLLPLWHKYYD